MVRHIISDDIRIKKGNKRGKSNKEDIRIEGSLSQLHDLLT